MTYDEAHAINTWASPPTIKGKRDKARERYVTSRRSLSGEIDERTSQVLPLQNIALLDFERGDYAEAVASYERLRRIFQPMSDTGSYLAVLNNLRVAQYTWRYERGRRRAARNRCMSRRSRSFPNEKARALRQLGIAYRETWAIRNAARCFSNRR